MNYESINRLAVFSENRVYRYSLLIDERKPDEKQRKRKRVTFIMLNPSTADEKKNDPTVTRCLKFMRLWGGTELCVVNLFAFRATDPRVMKAAELPVGMGNNLHILAACRDAQIVVAAWGRHGTHQGRAEAVLEMLAADNRPIMALRTTADGCPMHPLARGRHHIPYDVEIVRLR